MRTLWQGGFFLVQIDATRRFFSVSNPSDKLLITFPVSASGFCFFHIKPNLQKSTDTENISLHSSTYTAWYLSISFPTASFFPCFTFPLFKSLIFLFSCTLFPPVLASHFLHLRWLGIWPKWLLFPFNSSSLCLFLSCSPSHSHS